MAHCRRGVAFVRFQIDAADPRESRDQGSKPLWLPRSPGSQGCQKSYYGFSGTTAILASPLLYVAYTGCTRLQPITGVLTPAASSEFRDLWLRESRDQGCQKSCDGSRPLWLPRSSGIFSFLLGTFGSGNFSDTSYVRVLFLEGRTPGHMPNGVDYSTIRLPLEGSYS